MFTSMVVFGNFLYPPSLCSLQVYVAALIDTAAIVFEMVQMQF